MSRALDLAVVGGGVTATAVLEQLLPRLPPATRIAVIDRHGDFGGGVPYGHAARPSFLCNNPVHAQHDASYEAWLRASDRFAAIRESGDPLLQRWCAHNAEALAEQRYEALFLPRSVYGDFVREKTAAWRGAGVETIADEVIDIIPGFTLTLREHGPLTARVVLLATGSPPPLRDAADPSTLDPQQLATATEVILLGGNATAMEMLWWLDGHARHLHRITVITRGGRLPDARPSRNASPPAMPALSALDSNTAEALARAAHADADRAFAAGYTTIDIATPLFDAFLPRFDALSAEERADFVQRFGRAFKALNRRTPPEYADAADALRQRAVLRIARANVNAEHIEALRREHPHALVVDCRGWAGLEATSDPLLRMLLDRGLAHVNGSGIGLAADENLAVAPGLFVAGPLLAGVSNARHCYWNLETARRLFALAPSAAQPLCDIITSLCWRPTKCVVTFPDDSTKST